MTRSREFPKPQGPANRTAVYLGTMRHLLEAKKNLEALRLGRHFDLRRQIEQSIVNVQQASLWTQSAQQLEQEEQK